MRLGLWPEACAARHVRCASCHQGEHREPWGLSMVPQVPEDVQRSVACAACVAVTPWFLPCICLAREVGGKCAMRYCSPGCSPRPVHMHVGAGAHWPPALLPQPLVTHSKNNPADYAASTHITNTAHGCRAGAAPAARVRPAAPAAAQGRAAQWRRAAAAAQQPIRPAHAHLAPRGGRPKATPTAHVRACQPAAGRAAGRRRGVRP